MAMNKLLFILLSIIVIIVSFTACTSDTSIAELEAKLENVPHQGQSLVYAVDRNPILINPHRNSSADAIRIYKNVYSRLTRFDENANLLPDLAQSWRHYDLEGSFIYVFELRQGVLFHDGRELTADDILYSYEIILNRHRYLFRNVVRADAIDKYTVRFILTEFDPAFLNMTAHANSSIVPQKTDDEDDTEARRNINTTPPPPSGTGPFMIQEVKEGEYIILERNPNYYIPNEPKLEYLTLLTIPDGRVRVQALEDGMVDIARLAYVELDDDEEIIVMIHPCDGSFYYLNNRVNIFFAEHNYHDIFTGVYLS